MTCDGGTKIVMAIWISIITATKNPQWIDCCAWIISKTWTGDRVTSILYEWWRCTIYKSEYHSPYISSLQRLMINVQLTFCATTRMPILSILFKLNATFTHTHTYTSSVLWNTCRGDRKQRLSHSTRPDAHRGGKCHRWPEYTIHMKLYQFSNWFGNACRSACVNGKDHIL